MAKVIILCGRIASGKTYYANWLKSQTNAIILSVDDLMLKLSDSCLGSRHDDIAMRCENYFYGLAEQITAAGQDAIIDFGYWSKKEREAAKNYFVQKGIPAELHYVKIPEDKRLKQMNKRNEELLLFDGNNKNERVYIIEEELRHKLDLKFEEPSAAEIDKKIVESMKS